MRLRSSRSTKKHSGGDDTHELLRIAFVDLDVEHVDAGELLEQDSLALHDRFRRQRTDGAETEHRRAVRDHADQVSAARHPKDILCIRDDRFARGRNTRRISEGQVVLIDQGLGRRDRQLPRCREFVIVERRLITRRSRVFRLHERVLAPVAELAANYNPNARGAGRHPVNRAARDALNFLLRIDRLSSVP